MTSLRRRLLMWLLPATLGVAALASVGSYWGATLELARLLDEQLRDVAEHVGIDDGRLTVDRTNEPRQRLSNERADEVLIEVWGGPRLRFTSDPALRLPLPGPPGLRDVVFDGQVWHTFVVRRGASLIRAAQARDARWEALARVAVNLLWPIAALIPALGACIWFGIGYGLRPLNRLAFELSSRDTNSWAPICPRPLPTEIEPLVEALNAMLRRLESAFDAQSDFIADAAHELRTPVMALSLHAGLAQQASTAEERDQALLQVRRGIDRLNHLARQLLTLARVGPGAQPMKNAPVDLVALCRSVIIDRLALADAKSLELGLEAHRPVSIDGDLEKLRILLGNLLDNAIRYTPTHGHIGLVVQRDAAGVALSVQDDGPGIAAGERLRVLDRFYRGAEPSETGSGLGLAIVKRIVDEHAAVLSLEDAAGQRGLRVTVRFSG